MKKQCEPGDRECIRDMIAGLGERSFRKSYYPELHKIERLRTLLNESTDAIFTLSIPDGRFIDVNQSVCEQLSYPYGEVLMMSIFDVLSGGAEAAESILSGKIGSITFIASLCRRSGETIPYEISAHRVDLAGKAYVVAVARNITERQRAAKALEESEEKFRVLANMSSAAIYVHQGENVIFVNETAEKITGYSRAELMRMKFWEVVHPDMREQVRDRGLSRLQGEPVPTHYEIRLMTKSGEVRWAELAAKLITYRGKPTIVSTLFDITDRKHAEEEHARLAFIVMSSDEAILGKRTDGTITSWNQGAERMYGYTASEVIGHSVNILIPPERSEELSDIMSKIKRGEHIKNFETMRVTREGRKIDVSLTISPIYDKSGKIIGASSIGQNITERKRVEDRLRLTQFCVDHFTDSSIWLDQNGQIIYVNDATCSSTEYSKNELLSMHIWDIDPLYSPEIYARNWKIWEEQSERKARNRFESVHRTRSGKEFPVEITGNFFVFRGRKYFVTYDRDITDRKQAEEALSSAKAQAEMYVDLMGHDINNMNQVALGNLELAEELIKAGEKLGPDKAELIEKPIQSLNISSMLIDKIMKLRQLTLREPRLTHIDICDVLSDVKDRYSNISGRDITINYMPPLDCMVVANELIEEIFTNLVENSIKHSSPDKPLVISMMLTKVCEQGKEFNRISIEDDGPGIPDELKARLFTRFQRGNARVSGKGLRLYLVKTLVEDYHGRVWVEDRVPGDYTKGVKFVVMLPTINE